jgi:hypothetical protein
MSYHAILGFGTSWKEIEAVKVSHTHTQTKFSAIKQKNNIRINTSCDNQLFFYRVTFPALKL